jgi:hypothetical protein
VDYGYAILAEDGVTVLNTILASPDFVQRVYPGRFVQLAPDQYCEPGATWSPRTQTFTAPAE